MNNNTDNDSKRRKIKAYIIVFIGSFVVWFIVGFIGLSVANWFTYEDYYFNPYTGQSGYFYDKILFKALISGFVGAIGFSIFFKLLEINTNRYYNQK